MLIGIEFKRKKVYLTEDNRSVWFWRVAPYVKDANPVKVGAAFFFVIAMSLIFAIGAYTEP